jgi:hypothetical protein
MSYRYPWALGFLCILFFFGACANYRPHVKGPAAIESVPSSDSLQYSVFFVGDLGYDVPQGRATLRAMLPALRTAGPQSSLLVLGDITGPDGFDEDEATTAERERLQGFAELFAEVPGKVFFTPGERDLGRAGNFGRLDDLEDFFDEAVEKKIRFLPDNACSGPDDYELQPDIGLIGVSTAWYLADWYLDDEVSEDCDYNDRNTFMLAFGDEVKGYRDKTKIVMMHHPLQSNGNRGGRFTLGQHLFPLADVIPGAYLPLPGIGTIARAIQGSGGSRQDLGNLIYKEMIGGMKTQIEDEDNVIFLSAHEHNMMYVPEGNHHVVLAGSGSVKGPAGKGNDAAFAYGALGYGRLDFFADGSLYLSFIATENGESRTVFRRKIIDDRFRRAAPTLDPIPAVVTKEDTVATAVYLEDPAAKSRFHQRIFGTTYRDLYFRPVEVPIIMVDTLYQGLQPYRRGGGMTTQSLHTMGGNGRMYQLRSVRKNPVQLLPGPLEQSFAVGVVQDQFTALHPYAPLTLIPLQRAAGILGNEPTLAYIPKQPALGVFNTNFGDEMYYVEQRPDEDWSGTGLFANSENIISNDAVREEMYEDWKVSTDQRAYARARLFDFLVGDWDRHNDQWRWAETTGPEGNPLYKPIPRDRDQVYSNFDAGLLRLIALMVPEARKLRPFDYTLNRAKWRALNGKWNDRFFMNKLTEEDFVAEARFLQETLTDDLIDRAMLRFPEAVRAYSTGAADIDGKLKARRAQLVDFAREYYRNLARAVDIVGTGQDDYFEVIRQPDQRLEIKVYDRKKNGDADELYYQRVFDPRETKEVRLYGRDGNDRFELIGEGRSPIRVRVIGGTDKDEVDQDSGRGPVRVYDSERGLDVKDRGPGLRIRTSNYPPLNQYNFHSYKPDYATPYPVAGFNVDDGLFGGAGLILRRNGWNPAPYAQNHVIQATASTNGTVQLDYDAEFNRTFGYHKDFVLESHYRSPDYIVNFFGLGNETVEFESEEEGVEDLDYNRTRQERIYLHPQFRYRGRNSRFRVSAGPYYQRVSVDSTEGRLIAISDQVREDVFEPQQFAGLKVGLGLNTLAMPHIQDEGIDFQVFGGYTWNLGARDRQFSQIGGYLSYYYMFGNRIVGLATRVGFEHVDGEFEFYQGATLGGRTNFRSVRSERWVGNTSFYHNIDLRIRGFGLRKGAVPTVGGLLFGFDYGRVWFEGEDSDLWHTAFGGGVWVAPFNAVVIHVTYFRGDEDGRISVGGGFPF